MCSAGKGTAARLLGLRPLNNAMHIHLVFFSGMNAVLHSLFFHFRFGFPT
jgi:hypothetical protein